MKCGLICLVFCGVILADAHRLQAISLWLSHRITTEFAGSPANGVSSPRTPEGIALISAAATAIYAALPGGSSTETAGSHFSPVPDSRRIIPAKAVSNIPKTASGLLDTRIIYSRDLAWVVIGMIHRWQHEGNIPPGDSSEIQLVNTILSTATRGLQAKGRTREGSPSDHQWKFPTVAIAWWHAAARMTWRITGDTQYLHQSHEFGDYVKSAYSPRDTAFMAGHKDMISVPEIQRYVNMAQILPVLAVGADTLDAWFGHNTSFTLLRNWIQENTRFIRDSLMTVHMDPQQPVDVEATAITALACRMAGQFYRYKNPAASQLLVNWEGNLQRALKDPQLTPQQQDSTGIAYFRSVGEAQADLAATTWALFALSGQNPLEIPLLDPALKVSRTVQRPHEKTIWLKTGVKVFSHVIYSDHPDPEVLEIFDPLGNRVPVQRLIGEDKVIVELLNNRSGFYFLLLNDGNERTRIERVMVQ